MATKKEIISQATPCTFGFQYTRRSQVIWPTSAEAALACAQAAPSQPEGCVTLLHHGMWVEEGPGWWGDLSAALMVTSDLRDIWRDTSLNFFQAVMSSWFVFLLSSLLRPDGAQVMQR